jgi:hypothetical protein
MLLLEFLGRRACPLETAVRLVPAKTPHFDETCWGDCPVRFRKLYLTQRVQHLLGLYFFPRPVTLTLF